MKYLYKLTFLSIVALFSVAFDARGVEDGPQCGDSSCNPSDVCCTQEDGGHYCCDLHHPHCAPGNGNWCAASLDTNSRRVEGTPVNKKEKR